MGYGNLDPRKNPLGGGFYANQQRDDEYKRRQAATLEKYRTTIFGLPQGGEGGLLGGAQSSLLDLLNNPGQTDSTLFNQSLAANSQGTNQRLDAARGQFSRSGLGNSGLSAAMQQAIQGAGLNNASRLTAEEARRKEDLKRRDLQMLYDFIINPEVQKYGADKGVSVGNAQASAQRSGANAQAGASLIGSLAGAFGGCYTADELYGEDTVNAALSRWYMAKYADDDTYDMYQLGARDLAARVKADPALRAKVKPIFDHFVEVAKGDFPKERWQ